MPKTKDRVSDFAGSAKPYVDRALHDDELRDHVRQAYSAAREIYEELVAPRGVAGMAQRVAGDQDLQQNLRTAIAELRQAANRLQGRRQAHPGRNAMLLLAGITIGLLYNPVTGPSLRGWVKQRVFGSDDFGYEADSSGNSGAG
jgi:hypothetical protein